MEENKKNSFGDTLAKFEQERNNWTVKIGEMSAMFREMYKLAELQVELYSNRQILVEYKSRLMSITGKMEREIREGKRKTLDFYMNKSDFRTSVSERELLIETDVGELTERSFQIKNHVDFLHDTIKSIDNMIYGIKHRIELEQYKMIQPRNNN